MRGDRESEIGVAAGQTIPIRYHRGMAIRLHFPDPADSPTQRTPMRVRYSARPGEGIRLLYGHGPHTFTREAWAGFQAAGAWLEADSERECAVLRELLGVDISGKS